jgi:outer membrane protein assembly factor BamB
MPPHQDASQTARNPFSLNGAGRYLFPLICLIFANTTLAQTPGTKLWEATLGNHVFSSPAIGRDGTIYVGASMGDLSAASSNGFLYAISPQGTTNWFVKTFGDLRASPAIGEDGTIYAASFFGNLYSFSAYGTTNWSIPTAGPTYRSYIAATPAIGADGAIYVYVFSGYDPRFGYRDQLYSVSPNGTTNWVATLGTVQGTSQASSVVNYSSPAIGPDGTIYAASRNRTLFAISPRGTTNWVFAFPPWTPAATPIVFSSPAVGADGTVYIGSADGSLYAIDRWGRKKWAYLTGGPVECSPVLASDTVCFGSLDQSIYGVDLQGKVRWQEPLVGTSASLALASDGTAYIEGVASSAFYALDANHSNLWSFPFAGSIEVSSPALGSNGTIYFGAGGKLYALSGTVGPLDSPWPMRHHDPRHSGRAAQKRLETIGPVPGGAFAIDLVLEKGLSYDVQSSTNLLEWSFLTNLVSATYTNRVFDLEATNFGARFYRLSTQDN